MSLFKQAEEAAFEIDFAPRLLELLHQRSRYQCSSREDWAQKVRFATATETLMHHAVGTEGARDLPRLIDKEEADAVLGQMRAHDGLLLLTFHGGFRTSKRIVFQSYKKRGGVFIFSRLRAEADKRNSLFHALRALQDGEIVVLAPDGPFGPRSDVLNVFGKPAPAGNGASFLAFESACQTAWFSMSLDGYRFIPSVEFGPRREKNESASEFSARLYRFYSACIENLMTGDPLNIVLTRKWQRFLLDALAPAPENRLIRRTLDVHTF